MNAGFDLLGALSSGEDPASTAGTPARPSPDGHSAAAGALPCSRRGCSADADYALRWNNPRIHRPERRKTWLACADHLEHLSSFLADRGFLRETLEAAELDGGVTDAPGRRSASGPAATAPTTRGEDAE